MTADNLIHVADGLGRYVDDGFESGTQYWHGIRAISDEGELIAHGWHRTAAVDDDEPPSVVSEIKAVAENGNVLVSWSRPDENYQLHAYEISRGVDGQPPETIATTWQLDQTSLLDDDAPTSGQIVYEIVAMDFHWNKSAPGRVTINLP